MAHYGVRRAARQLSIILLIQFCAVKLRDSADNGIYAVPSACFAERPR